ncbi:MAG: hypothetical protein HYT34_00745, partial [Candidatus Ryanbacteria bacterium]|nr:hypothetical protein [Candidatus Ryanbacteria bacterium]
MKLHKIFWASLAIFLFANVPVSLAYDKVELERLVAQLASQIATLEAIVSSQTFSPQGEVLGTSTSTAGGYAVRLDTSNPPEKWYAGGSTGVTTTLLRFTATSESIAITNLRLQIGSSKGDVASRHVAKISLWDGSTLLSEKISPAFLGDVEDFVFPTTGVGSFIIPADSFKVMTIRVDLATICAGCSGSAGSPIYIDYDGDGTALGKNRGVGISSGLSIHSSSAIDTSSAGIRYFRSVPSFQQVPLPTSALISGNQVLYRFRVNAHPAYDIALKKFTFAVGTSSVAQMRNVLPSFKLYNITDAQFVNIATGSVVSYFDSKKNYDSLNRLLVRTYSDDTSNYPLGEVRIPAGQSKDFELRGTVTYDATVGGSIATILLGDMGAPALGMVSYYVMDSYPANNTIWSDYSGDVSGTHSLTSYDWINGYRVPGLPTTGLDAAVLGSGSGGFPPTVNIVVPTRADTYSTNSNTTALLASVTKGNLPLATSTARWTNAATGASGRLIPTPYGWLAYDSVSGTYAVSLAEGTNQVSLSISDVAGNVGTDSLTVSYNTGGTTITVLSPNAGEKWQLGNTHSILWTPYDPVTGVNPAQQVSAYLEKLVSGSFVRIGKIIECGKASIHWDGSLDVCGVGGKFAEPGEYYIYLINNQTGQWDRSDKPFTLVARDYLKADLKINGSDADIAVPAGGGTYTASWTSNTEQCSIYNDTLPYTDPEYRKDNLAPFGSISIKLLPNNDWYTRSVSLICTSKIAVEGSAYDKIGIPPLNQSITVVSPNG